MSLAPVCGAVTARDHTQSRLIDKPIRRLVRPAVRGTWAKLWCGPDSTGLPTEMKRTMTASRAALFERLAALGIETRTVEHAPVFTVEQSKALRGDLPGGHCKTLLLKDKKGALWLVVCLEDTPVDIKSLARLIGSARWSFAKPELLRAVLGVEPGSVTPFALINDVGAQVTVVLDKTMLQSAVLNYHPLHNDATTRIRSDDLQKFIAACGHRAKIVELPI